MPSIMRFQRPPKAETLNHIARPHVNNLPDKLIDGKAFLLTAALITASKIAAFGAEL